MSDQINIFHSLGRIESRLDQQDIILAELREGNRTLSRLAQDFGYHLQADAALTVKVDAIIEGPKARRRAVGRWIAGIAATCITAVILVLFGLRR